MPNVDEVTSSVIEHAKWYYEDSKKWNRPICGATENLMDAFTNQMKLVYKLAYEEGLETAHEIAEETVDFIIKGMREYARKHPKTTLDTYLKKNYPEEN